jgi:preprotein translocase subunit SecA
MLDEWYQLDTNNIPIGRYVLKNLIDKDDAVFWSVQSKIREALQNIPFDRDQYCNDILIDRSVTEYETRFALSNVADSNRCLWISREFESGVPDVNDYNDTFHSSSDKLKLNNLKMMMYDKLSML